MPPGDSLEPIRYEIEIPEPTPEQLLALQGLSNVFGWRVSQPGDTSIPHLTSDTPTPVLKPKHDIILIDDETTAIQPSSRHELEHAKGLSEFKSILDKFLNPYAGAFLSKLPAPQGSKLKRKFEAGLEDTSTWSYKEPLEGIEFSYSYRLNYQKGKSANSLKDIQLDVSSPLADQKFISEFAAQNPLITLKFNDLSNINKVSFQWAREIAGPFIQTRKDMAITSYMSTYCPYPPDTYNSDRRYNLFTNCSLTLDVDGGTLHIEQEGYCPKESGGYKEYSFQLEFKPIFEQGKLSFKRIILDKEKFDQLEEELGVKFPETLSVVDFVGITQAILDVVPTISTDELYDTSE